jgi:ribosome biogenesis GTPase
LRGIVIKSTGSWYHIKHNDAIYTCRLRGKFRIKDIKSTNPITVGDVVEFELEKDKNTGVINTIQERKNYIIRKSVNLSKETHIIASNIDQVFLLITIDNPPTLPGFIDRFLASAQAYHIPCILLFNKIDLNDDALVLKRQKLKDIYQKIGYNCIDISAKERENINILIGLMKDKVSMFAGHSGVGKSTLANAIHPTLNLKTKAISEQHKQGQHTTTFAEMFELPFGGYLIDTPGIKGFGLVDFEPQEVTDYFIEFFKLKSGCKFNNCLHINEPKCAVKKALENGEIAASRYNSYIKIINGDDENYRVDEYAV